jgi:DNA-binding NarL/FixJ family response regulator
MAEQRMVQPERVNRILVLASNGSLAQRLERALRGQANLAMSGAAHTVAETLDTITLMKPDLLLLEVAPDGPVGVEGVRLLRDERPKLKLLARSGTDAPAYAQQVLDAGADGYILRSEGMRQLIQAMRDVLRGHLYVSDRVIEGE